MNRRSKRAKASKRAVVLPTPRANENEPTRLRERGDSYSDIVSREDDLVGTSSSHRSRPDRQREEPSELPIGGPERLEGDL